MEAGRESRVSGEVAAYSDARTSVIATSPSSELRPLMPIFAQQQFRAEHVSVGSRLCENSDVELARRNFVSIALNRKRTVLAVAVVRGKGRKQFFALSARAWFHTC